MFNFNISQENLFLVSEKLIRISSLLVIAWIIKKAIKLILKRSIKNFGEVDANKKKEKRLNTINSLIKNTSSIVINMTVFLLILAELGFNILPLITGVGIFGLAIGMGAKDLASDLIAGFFILLENHLNIGDTIRASGVSGKVRKMSLRTITLRDSNGDQHIIPNSALKTITKIKVKKK